MNRHLTPSNWPLLWKAVYIFVYMMVLLGLLFAAVLIAVNMGHTPKEILSYYRGDLDTFRYPKSLTEIAETAHFHSMISPLVLAFLSLPLPWTPHPEWLKGTAVGLGMLGVFLLILNPWILRYGPPALIFLKYVGGISLILGVVLTGGLVVVSFWNRGD